MFSKKPKANKPLLITQTLLSSWQWCLRLDHAYDDFLKTLRRVPIQKTKAMLEGIRFENVLCAVLNGEPIDTSHEWYDCITELQPTLQGAAQQARISRHMQIQGVDFVLYGVLDFLKAGIIYDTKYSKTYRVGKYLDSPQHPMYFALVPEAREFQYKICDGKDIFTETYRPDETEPIERIINSFLEHLQALGLTDIYYENWESKY